MKEVKRKDGKIYALLKEKWLIETPEEQVRQNYICKLINDYGYSLHQMEQEVTLTNSRRGTGSARADIVIWASESDKIEKNSPIIIVECKAQNITIKEEDYFQGQNYAYYSGAKFFVTTNEKEAKYFQVIQGKVPKSLGNEIIAIPKASELKDTKKIEKLLNATKTFERDEFAKLLFACHNVIRDNDKYSPEMAFDEISKILFIKIWYERKQERGKIFSLDKFKELKKANDEVASQGEKLFYQKIFDNVKKDYATQDLFDKNDTIKLRENSIESIIKKLEKYNLSDTSDDVKGIAFEEFLGKTFRGELGQFFTPRTLVDFMVELLDPKEGEVICDPCCGSGGFLIKAFEYIRECIEKEIQNEKKDIKHQYFDKTFEKATAEEKEKITQKVNKLLSTLNEELNPSNENSRLYKLSYWSIFGTDANPRMSRTAKMNMIMHGDGHGGLHHNDGLLNINGIFENRFDVILTNPPFGSRVAKDQKITEEDKYRDTEKINHYNQAYGEEYQKAIKQVTENVDKPLLSLYDTGNYSSLTETLFIERCLKLLKPGGRMGIVLPEGVLNNANLTKVRDYFESKAKIILIVSIPQDVFMSAKANVKPSLVFFKKFTEKEEQEYKTILKEVSDKQERLFKPKYDEIDKKITQKEAEIKAETNKEQIKYLKEEVKQLKKEAKTKKKELDVAKQKAITKEVKQLFNYPIPICEIEKAGIDSKGAKIENELIPLLKEFTTYRKENTLWEEIRWKNAYDIIDDQLKRNTIVAEELIPYTSLNEAKKKSLIYEYLKFIYLINLSLWDVKRYLIKKLEFNYQSVFLSEILSQSDCFEGVENEKEYFLCGVKLYGKGVFHREKKLGKLIKGKKLNKINYGQFIYSRLGANNGSFATVTKEFDGYYVTNEFPVFNVDRKKINVDFLSLLFKSNFYWNKIDYLLQGAAHKRFKEKVFLDFQIPLPNLAAQEAIIARYSEKIKEAEELEKYGDIKTCCDEVFLNNLGIKKPEHIEKKVGLIFVWFSDLTRWDALSNNYIYTDALKNAKINLIPLEKIACFVKRPWNKRENIDKTFNYIELGSINPIKGVEVFSTIDVEKAPSRATQVVKEGDLIIGTTRPYLKRFAEIKKEHNNFVCSSGFSVIENTNSVNISFIKYFLMSSFGEEQLSNNMSGALYPAITSKSLKEDILIPHFSKEKQNAIVSELDKMVADRKERELRAKELRQEAIKEFEMVVFKK